ncbi:porin family protein [Flavobacterium sedimenticola]|uniref:Porin family protein n=1 Tax=Flavobacterium sedimenticola TaxID=3043286 RepID=A0ABT6XQT9_9FLAO|nr:porin family protein [Flavobacterium sedimenticola]MDI9257431.1 porin family protein [Flavobacterium sedimenticola]
MKKVIFTMAAVFALTFANAQDKKGGSSDMKFGVKAGYINSNFTGDYDTDATSGFYVGGLVDFSISEKFHVQPELLYSMEGAKDAALNFVRIPVMAKYYVMEGLNLQAGPQFGFVAGGDDIKDNVKSLDYGLGIGAGYELESGLFFDARYNLGLANISDIDGVDANTTSFQVGLGYRF